MTIDRDPDARRRMAEIHAEYSDSVLRFLIGLTGGDRFSAEDLLQETMPRAWRFLDSVPAGDPECRRWLLTVARRVTIDSVRRRQRRRHEVQLTDLVVTTVDETVGTVLAGYVMRQALHALSPAEREVLIELYLNGKPLKQVAALLGTPLGTVKSRAHHAVQVVRQAAARSAA